MKGAECGVGLRKTAPWNPFVGSTGSRGRSLSCSRHGRGQVRWACLNVIREAARTSRGERCFVGLVSMTLAMDPRYTPAMASTVHPRITIEPGKCGGKPCIRGMRIRVSDVLELLANGAPVEEILADYPCLEREDILAAIAYAAQQTNHVVVEVA